MDPPPRKNRQHRPEDDEPEDEAEGEETVSVEYAKKLEHENLKLYEKALDAEDELKDTRDEMERLRSRLRDLELENERLRRRAERRRRDRGGWTEIIISTPPSSRDEGDVPMGDRRPRSSAAAARR